MMRSGGLLSRALFVPVSLAIGALLGLGMVTLVVQAATPAQKIEIVIKNGEAKVVRGATLNGVPTEVSVRNEDTITHGFNSSIFERAGKVEMSGGYHAEGKHGPHVYRVDPGKTMVINFTLPDQPGGESRTFSFWCDMHRSVKGEMLVVEYSGETGGG
jgi:hypothetical protein